MIQKTCYKGYRIGKVLISHSREPSTSPERENLIRLFGCRQLYWSRLSMDILVAINLEKRPSFLSNASLWCVLIQESNSLNDFLFVRCIRGSYQKGVS